jgi:MFS family permease
VIVVFLVGSALSGVAQTMPQLIAFRALQGLGGGGLIVTAMATVADLVPPRERGRYQGLFGGVFGIATVIGPLLGASSSTTSRGAGSSTSTCRSARLPSS